MKDFKVVRSFSCIIAACIILFAGIASAYAAAARVPDSGPASQNTLSENTLLQFNAGGHILGFKPDKVYFASLDHAIVEEFVGTKGVMPVGEAGQAVKENPEGLKGAPALGKVVYKNLWQGITLKYEAKNNGMAESSYLLEPEADVNNIKLKYNVSAGIEKDGSLRFKHSSDKGYFSLSAPKAWQEIAGKRMPVEVAFADYGDNTIGFRLGQYNRQYTVIIDPTYQWHTFYGGAGNDYGNGIAVDSSGNVYVTGSSAATWNGPGATAPLNPYSGSSDIVVMKLNSAGAYQWHTFYGSIAGSDTGLAIAVDSSSANVYVTGYSIATWNAGVTAPLNAYNGNNDIVVLKLNSAGAYQWHTFYGGPGGGGNNDYGRSLSLDSGGNVYVTGNSNTAWNGPGATAPLNSYSGGNDIVVMKLDSAGTYQWHTFYGSVAGHDYGRGIALDSFGYVYVAGQSTATWNAGVIAPLNTHSGSTDMVVLKLNSAGAYQWHTFYGSAGFDTGYSIAVDSGGNVYVAGDSDNATWSSGVAAPLNPFSGAADIVVLKLNSAGAYQWHTFYGSVAGNDYDNGIAVDSGGNVYVSAYSYAAWNAGVTAPLNPFTFSGAADIVVFKLSTGGAYQWHTFYGSAGTDVGYGIAVDSGGHVYLTGNGNATWNAGVTAPLNAYSGNYDIVVLKLESIPPTAVADSTNTVVGTPGTFDVSTNDTKPSGATYSLATGSTCAAASVNGAGVAGYTAPSTVLSTCTVNYTICNPAPDSTTCASSTLTVAAIAGTPPTAAADSTGTLVGSAGTYDVSTNDIKPVGAAYSLAAGSTCAGSSVSPVGVAGYTAPSTVLSTCTVNYTVCNPAPDNTTCASSTLTVTATAGTPPTAVADITSKLVGTAGTYDVSTNDTKPAGATYSLAVGSTCAGSSVSPVGVAGFTAPITVSTICTVNYTVCNPAPDSTTCATSALTVTAAAGTPPTAVADSTSTLVGSAGTYDVTTNDTKPVGATYSLAAGSTCAGSSVNGAGVAGYTAPITVSTICTVNYTVCNPAPDSTTCASSTLTVTATAGTPPTAVADSTSTNTVVGTTGTYDVSTNDTKPAGATYSLATGSTCAGSSMSVAGVAGFTAPITAGATCTVNYQVCNPAPDSATCASSTLTVTAIAGTPPTAMPDSTNALAGSAGTFDVSTNDIKPAGATYSLATGSTCAGSSVSPVGVAGFTAPITAGATCTVNYQVCNPAPDSATCASSTLTVTAIAGTPPTIVPTMNEWGMMIFTLLAGLGSIYYLRKYRRI